MPQVGVRPPFDRYSRTACKCPPTGKCPDGLTCDPL